MAIIQKDGFNFMDGLNSHFIVVESNRTSEYIRYINDQPKTKIDLSQFQELDTVYVDLNKNVLGLVDCLNLRVLKLWKYKPKSKDLSELSNLSNLVELELTQSLVTSLMGGNALTSLKKVGLYYCSKLESIQSITKGSGKINQLFVESCKNIRDFYKVSVLKELEKLSLTESGEVPSLEFIEQLPNLKSFVFMGTTVRDGNLKPCEGLQYVAFTEKKHYTHKMKDFKNS